MKKSSEEVFYEVPKSKPPRYDLRKLKVREDKDSKDIQEEDEDLGVEK